MAVVFDNTEVLNKQQAAAVAPKPVEDKKSFWKGLEARLFGKDEVPVKDLTKEEPKLDSSAVAVAGAPVVIGSFDAATLAKIQEARSSLPQMQEFSGNVSAPNAGLSSPSAERTV